MKETTGLKADIDQLPALVPSLQTHDYLLVIRNILKTVLQEFANGLDEEENERVPKKSTERKQTLKTRRKRDLSQRTDHFTKKKSSSFGSFIPNLKVVVQLEYYYAVICILSVYLRSSIVPRKSTSTN